MAGTAGGTAGSSGGTSGGTASGGTGRTGGRRSGSTASVSGLKSADLTTEDGYRKWTKVASDLTEASGAEYAFAAELLRKILLRTPLSNPKTGVMGSGYDPKRTPRRIAAYLKRAADAQRYSEGQIKAAWKLFEKAYVIQIAGQPKGMKMDRDGAKKTGRSA